MHKLPIDANGHPVNALKPMAGTDKATTETFVNNTGATIFRLVATDGNANIIISEDGSTSGDGVYMPQNVPEYMHVPKGWSVYVSGATVNIAKCA